MDRVLETLLSQGGVWAALFLLAALTAAYLYKEVQRVLRDCNTQAKEHAHIVKELSDARLLEIKEAGGTVLVALERNTTSAAARAVALESINASMAKLTEGFAVMAQTQDSRGERCREQVGRIEDMLREQDKRLAAMERRQEVMLGIAGKAGGQS